MKFAEIAEEARKLRADLADDPTLSMGNARVQAQHFKQLAFTALGLIEALAQNLEPPDGA